MITADTITDEQIEALRGHADNTYADEVSIANALSNFGEARHSARARCAEILEARRVK